MSSSPRPSIASFWRDLPREGRLLLSVVAFEFVGTGLVLPFWVVYLHEIRGFSLDVVGLLLAGMSAAGVMTSIPGGTLIDRIGPRRAMIAVLVAAIVGEVVMAFASSLPVAILGVAIVGGGFGLGWPSVQALVSSVVPSGIRARYFGMNFSLLNLGIGIGGILGGLIVDVDRPFTFQAMYLGNAVSYLPGLFLMVVPLRHVGGPAAVPPEHADAPRVSYLSVLRAPAMGTLCSLMFVSAFVGYAQLNSGMPAYARAIGDVSTRGLGLAFAANTLVIVLLQLVVLQRIEGRRRTRVIAVMSFVWAVSWALLGASGLWPATWSATFFVAACASVFALGETLLQPTMPAIVNDLAPEHLRGRYNGLTSGCFQAASILGPVVAGFMIGHDLHLEYLVVLVVGCGAVAWLSAARLEGQLGDRANGLLAGATVEPPDATVAKGVTAVPPVAEAADSR
ncbi:MAG TPA: MFS transporter [Marmoricola sp.]|nr:MFS transporter [Marmoricola sp.]